MKIIQILVFFSFFSAFSQGITIDNSSTANQLVDMLLNDACVEVSNISMSSNLSVASFDNNNSSFPIQEGVVLRSGLVQDTEGIYTGENLSTQENSNSDNDLQEVVNSSGQTVPVTDVAYLQFDFVPISNKVSLDFLLASNEYGEFQCISNDAIGFILKNLDTGESVNIGVIPETVVPVSVKNIRDNAYNASCVSDNEEYFDTYNVDTPASSSLNMRGHTQVISTEYDLQPGNNYRIRFLVGDSNDADYDSAVFLAGGSFETRLDLGEDFTLCGNETHLLNTEIDAGLYDHVWLKDGVVIPGETSAEYNVTTGGVYEVQVTNNDGNCMVSDEIIINQFLIGQPEDKEFCLSATNYRVFLDDIANIEIIIGEPYTIYELAFFLSYEDAVNYENPITLESLENSGGVYFLQPGFEHQTFWVVVESNDGSNCSEIISFDAIENPLPEMPEEVDNVSGCDSYELPPLNNENHYETVNGELLPEGTIITESGSYYIVTPPNEYGCVNRRSFSVNLIKDFVLPLYSCGEFIVPVPPEGTDFYTEIDGPNGNGTIIEPGTTYTEDVTIYYYAEIDGVICKNEAIPKNILPAPQLEPVQNIISCEPYVLPEIGYIGEMPEHMGYYTAPNGNGSQMSPGTVIDSYTVLYIYAETGSCTRNEQFQINIVPEFNDVETCAEYTMPYLPGNYGYYTEPIGEGYEIEADSVLTESQTIFVYYNTYEPNCTDSLSFDLTIYNAPPIDSLQNAPLACESDFYVLPPLTHGNYYSESNGGGVQLNAGDVIEEPQTIYIFNEFGGCFNETVFEVENDYLPQLENFTDVYACNTYELPTPAQGNFYTETLGTGEMLNGGDIITETQLIYIYIDAGPDSPCFQEKAFTVNIIDADIEGDYDDVTVCDEYILPVLDEGNYYTESGGEGTMLSPGTSITETQDIYVYLEKGVRVSCISEDVFAVTVSETPQIPNYNNVEACGSYALENLPNLDANINYYWEPNGESPISVNEYTFSEPGDYTIYVYAYAENNPNCYDQEVFNITIFPLLDFEVEGGFICLDPETGDVESPLLLESGINSSEFQIDWFLNGNLIHTGESLWAEQPGEYTVQTTKLSPEVGADCNYNPATVVVEASSAPVIEATVSEDFSENASISVQIVEGYGEYMYQLDNNPFQWDHVFTNVSSGEHTITVTDINANCGDAQVVVDVINYPKFFTPNNDGVNDTWNITDLSNNRDAMIYIHDRFGKLLISFSPSRGEWDGVYNGANMPSNDYWFKVIYTRDGKQKEFVSHFTLKR
ncbi:choice-of-anchor L domain-containing protein [Mesonia sp.]|uniref:T9SS type B sorting domain-containing protein n=1 Tax=Mesonia sp. TaxID=1960830 RepID=UPI0032424E97